MSESKARPTAGMYQAVTSFSAVLENGTDLVVHTGDMFPADHELVERDADTTDGRVPGQLFKKAW